MSHFESEADYQAYCQAEAEAQAQAEYEAGEYEYLQAMLDAKEYYPWALHICWKILEKPHPEAAKYLMDAHRKYQEMHEKEAERLKRESEKPSEPDDLPF
ncbi:hypothetical protein C8N40_11194 [Pontibacter mucosus]|uniref:Uncharacterized protein n=1 Tax=Pontibacter mucosus TaxID=1649266 RepID=A0A2T5YD32_9BACT|nr:hypothetical protein [Pontibacter mucosus]PTX14429.1 hypothetical protein C8N40_11194 [Pontibacter mucosus]